MPPKTKHTRSRNGCQNCKRLKMKCSETKPVCAQCTKQGVRCDYTVKLKWDSTSKFNSKVHKIHFVSPSTSPALSNQLSFINTTIKPNINTDQKRTLDDHFQLNTSETTSLVDPQLLDSSTDFDTNKNGGSLPSSSSSSSSSPFDQENDNNIDNNIKNIDHSLNSHNYYPSATIDEEITEIISPKTQFLKEINRINDIIPMDFKIFSTEFNIQSPYDEIEFNNKQINQNDIKSIDEIYFSLSPNSFINFPSSPTIQKSLHALPDMLLNDQFYYESFTFFVGTTSKILVAAPENIYKFNPFQKLLPMLAVANDSILCIILSFAILHKASIMNEEIPKGVINKLQKRGFKSFKKLISDNKFLSREKYNATDDIILVISLLLGSFDIFSASESGQWLTHVKEAKDILFKRRALTFEEICFKVAENKRNHISLESDLFFFLYRWLSFIDVVGLMASPILIDDTNSINNKLVKEVKPILDFNKIDQQFNKIHNIIESDKKNLLNSNNKLAKHITFRVDPLLGFDLRFIPLFDYMIDLIKETNNHYKYNNSLHSHVLERAIKLEKLLTKVYKSIQPFKDIDQFSNHDILYSTNKIFYFNALLNLYRRVFLMDRNTPIIQELCFKIKDDIDQYLEPGSPAETCSMVCIFTASVESIDPNLQKFFNERLERLVKSGNTCVARKALQVVRKTWETGLNWIDVTNEMMGSNLAFI